MSASGNPEKLGLYVSVPFCRAKCSFCNFASGVSGPAAIEAYLKTLLAEIDGARASADAMGVELPRNVDTLYFGGGTPSLLEPVQLREVFAALRRNFNVAADAEITMEAAPGQISHEVLGESMRLGVNRVSLGVQSFVDRECSAVGRTHSGEDCLREIARLRAAGLQDVGADLIAGLPYQDEASWRHSLERVAKAELTHVSVYMLEVDEDSRLGREALRGGLRLHAPKLPSDDAVTAMYAMACEELPRMGFAQYEISNFAKAGWPSTHNRKYWERAPYRGFGLDAHSMLRQGTGNSEQGTGLQAVRFANADELESYGRGEGLAEVTEVGLREAFEESVFLGLRLNEGLAMRSLRCAFPQAWVDEACEAVRELCVEGLLEDSGERWRLTLRGRLVSNEVFGHLLSSVAV